MSFYVSDLAPMTIVPVVNGRSLIDLVTDFERSRNYARCGGLVSDFFNYGDFRAYLLGLDNRQWPRPGMAWLLGCDCGEVGCWPLEARVDAGPSEVVWSDFRQPFRPDRDYRGFVHFSFNRREYEAGVQEVMARLTGREAER